MNLPTETLNREMVLPCMAILLTKFSFKDDKLAIELDEQEVPSLSFYRFKCSFVKETVSCVIFSVKISCT